MATKNMRRAVMQTTRRGRSAALDDRDASRGAPLIPLAALMFGGMGASLGAVFITKASFSAPCATAKQAQDRLKDCCLPFTCSKGRPSGGR